MTAPDTDDELTAVAEFLFRTITADATALAALPGGVHDDMPPADTPTPFAVIGISAGNDAELVDGIIVLTDVVARVIVTTDAPTYPGPAALAVHNAIHRANDYGAGGRVHACRRIQPLRYAERENDRPWRHQGGIYRLSVGPPA